MKAIAVIITVFFGMLISSPIMQAQMWMQTSTNTGYDWSGVASAADGTKLAATLVSAAPTSAEGIYLSTNSGMT